MAIRETRISGDPGAICGRHWAQKFAPSNLPLERLPASFEAQTTMHLGAEDWEVQEARPVTAAEFKQTGKLVLLVRKVKIEKFSSLDNILYSLPTISHEWPPMAANSSKLGKTTLELHEDDWRQVEWVAASLEKPIELEFEAIRRIWDNERQGPGFKKVHPREQVPAPMRLRAVDLQNLASALGTKATLLDGISLSGAAGLVAEGFALRLFSSIEVYGTTWEGRIEVAGFKNTKCNNAPAEDMQNLVAFAARHDLLLVDWCRALKVEPHESDYQSYFTGEREGV